MQILNKNIIGLDRENVKIIFLDRERNQDPVFSIDLNQIKSSETVEYRKNAGGHIQRIDLRLTFKDPEAGFIDLPFYDESRDKFYRMMRLAKKAYHWQKSIEIFREIAAAS